MHHTNAKLKSRPGSVATAVSSCGQHEHTKLQLFPALQREVASRRVSALCFVAWYILRFNAYR